MRGKPRGSVVEGRARVLSGEDAERADAALASNWTASMRAMERGMEQLPVEIAYVEVEPQDPPEGKEAPA
jgi:hypothetical protein